MTTCTFDREKHAYAIDGEPAFSVTQALRLAGLEDDYSRVPPAIRMKAAQRGTYVHEATDLLDQFVDTDDAGVGELAGRDQLARKQRISVGPRRHDALPRGVDVECQHYRIGCLHAMKRAAECGRP